MPVNVVKKVVKIQREFLWGGLEGGRKISWKVVCQPKEVGGLGVRDVSLVNLSLLAKWKWRLLQGDNTLWKEILVERYGLKVGEFLKEGVGVWPANASRWWKDLVSLAKGNEVDWFYEEVVRKVGNGATTSFWKATWRGGEPFMIKFHKLFSIATFQEATIQEMWVCNVGGGRWRFSWRRQLFIWEVNLFDELLGVLEGFVLGEVEDEWRWKLEKDDIFTVKSMYLKLEGRGLAEVV